MPHQKPTEASIGDLLEVRGCSSLLRPDFASAKRPTRQDEIEMGSSRLVVCLAAVTGEAPGGDNPGAREVATTTVCCRSDNLIYGRGPPLPLP